MNRIEVVPLKKPITADITLPGSLSYTIRAMALGAMAEGSVKIENALKSDDTYVMFDAFRILGIRCEENDDFFVIEGDLKDVKEGNYEINAGISGRSARTLLAMLCLVPGTKILTCGESFKKRPVGDLVDGLLQMGAKIEYLENEGYLPVKISSSRLSSGKIKLHGEVSSQFVSAVLMIAPMVGDVMIETEGEQTSKPFVDMTIGVMKNFGVEVRNNNYHEYFVKGKQAYKRDVYFIEPDATSASYFWSIAALTKSKIKVLNLSPEALQGDALYADILRKMGCIVRKNASEEWMEVEGGEKIEGLNEINMNSNPDIVQTLAVTAAFAKGKTVITGIGNLRVKETDRIEATGRELKKMGVQVDMTRDSMTIYGGSPHGSEIDTYGDHRMAMAFAVAGARIPGMIINDPNVVNKSFPEFWEKLEEIGVRLGDRA